MKSSLRCSEYRKVAVRLDKYITSVTDLSRKQVRLAVKAQQVEVDGELFTDPSRHIDATCEVLLDGVALRRPGHRYIMLHKPAGVICATRDAHQTTVLDLLDLPRLDNLQIAGRLDRDTTGLVLITDDGRWNHRVTSPRRACEKCYQVTTARPLEPGLVADFGKGIVLQPEGRRTRPARLVLVDECHARLYLTEGRYHQVKRMFAAAGNHVEALHRQAIGSLELDPALAPGEYRYLSSEEAGTIDHA